MVMENAQRGTTQLQTGQLNEEHSEPGPIIVGCALLPKKVQRYLTQRMLQTAADNNIQIKQIDHSKPLGPQGPFNVIIHKLRPNPDWEQQLRQYVSDHPETVVVDRIDKIRQLHNRATMLRPLQGDGVVLQQPTTQLFPLRPQHKQPHQSQQQPTDGQVVLVQAPLQVEIAEGTTEAEAQAALAAAGLAPPLLCKPLWTDGRDGSHKLAVLHDLEALGRLLRGAVCNEFKPPLVVQQFVEHGGVLFKVYVLGNQTYVTARPSLGETVLEPAHAVQQLPRISCVSVFSKQQQHKHQMQKAQVAPATVPAPAPATCAAAAGAAPAAADPQHSSAQHASVPSAQLQQQQQPSAASAAVAAESVWRPPSSIVAPPAWLTSALAATLRQELGMQLFNFDLIVPEQQPVFDGPQSQAQQQQVDGPDAAPALCYVVDINFFPGVDKIPDFEQRFVNFLLAAAEGGPSGPDCAIQKYQQQLQQQQQAAAAAVAAQQAAVLVGKGATPGDSSHSSGGVLQHSRRSGGSSDGAGRRSSSTGGDCGARSGSSCGGGSRRLQHSTSADRASAGTAAAGAAAAAGVSGQRSRRHSGAGGSSSGSGSSSRHGGLDVAGVSPVQWGDRGVLGSSPPPQLQVAGCS